MSSHFLPFKRLQGLKQILATELPIHTCNTIAKTNVLERNRLRRSATDSKTSSEKGSCERSLESKEPNLAVGKRLVLRDPARPCDVTAGVRVITLAIRPGALHSAVSY